MSIANDILKKYGQAVGYLPKRLRACAMSLDDAEKVEVQEFRLRAGRHMSLYINGRERFSKECGEVSPEELSGVLELATESSVHSARESICRGFVTVAGGHRIGLCGTMIRGDGGVLGMRELSSVSVRIAKEITSAAEMMPREVIKNGAFQNTLIISPPGFGKTTALRDLVRRLSDMGYRISLIDERGEIAAKHRGLPQFDVGKCTDVLDGIGKDIGAMQMLRAMTPDIIALDEITDERDIDVISGIVNCGVGILATAHGESPEQIFSRPAYKRLSSLCVFKVIITLKRYGNVFTHKVTCL